MSRNDLDRLLTLAVDDVLETMFFSESSGPCQPDPSAELEADVAFTGETSGTVGVRIAKAAAASLAASFLGESEDSLSDIQIGHVVCELANMLCGCIVSKMPARGCFTLGSPGLRRGKASNSIGIVQVQQSFAIERGILTVSMSSSESA